MSEAVIHPAASSQRPSEGRILCVDDNAGLRQSMAEWLRDAGYVVLQASSAEEAIELVQARPADGQDPIDLLITDFHLPGHLPGLNGLELARRLRSRFSRLPILLISSRLPLGDLEVWRQEGDFDALAKPFGSREIEARVRALLEGRQSERAALSARSGIASIDRPTPQPFAGRTTSRWAGAAMGAAMAAIVVWAVVYSTWTRPEAPPLPERRVAPGVMRSGVMVDLEPFGPIAETPSVLRWRPHDGTHRYHVELKALDGEILLDVESESAQIDLSSELRSSLRPLAPYFWKVEALDANSIRLATSEVIRIRIVESASPEPVAPEPGRSGELR